MMISIFTPNKLSISTSQCLDKNLTSYWLGRSLIPLVLVAVIIAFAIEIRSISLVNGWWFDELWSLLATDPSLAFKDLFAWRIGKDTTPPLYYVALFWVRCLIADERSAVVILNLAAIAAAFMAIGAASRKAEVVGWALVGAVAFLLSGPVLRYVIEGRSYLMALAVAFAASWFCALAIEVRDRRPNLTAFALVGTIAALTHVYAALVCCCLASGLALLSYSNRRRDLLPPALALGVSAGIVTLVFIAWAIGLVGQANWIKLSYHSILEAYWEVRQLTLGSRLAMVLFAALFVAGSIVPSTRPLTAAFGLAWVLFVLIPLLASLEQPVIVGRYWLIGAPSLIVFVVFLMRAFFTLGARTAGARLYWGGWFASLVLLLLTDASGYIQARTFTSWKPIWRGAEFVAPLVQNCPAASVHVAGFVAWFAAAAHVPEALFVDATSPEAGFVRASNSSCSVLGWAEHLDNCGVLRSDEELLYMLKIAASPSEVDIVRHWNGFVVTQRGVLAEAGVLTEANGGFIFLARDQPGEGEYRAGNCIDAPGHDATLYYVDRDDDTAACRASDNGLLMI